MTRTQLAILAFLSGIASLLMQLSLSRIIFFYVANSEYNTALVVSAHLSGFLLGALLKRNWLSGITIAHALLAILLLNLVVIIFGFIAPVSFLPPVNTIIVLTVTLLLIAVMFGLIIASLLLENKSSKMATDIVVADTLGSAIGALLVGFILLPIFGIIFSLWSGILIIIGMLFIVLSSGKKIFSAFIAGTSVILLVVVSYYAFYSSSQLLRVAGLPLPFKLETHKIIAEKSTPFGELSIVAMHKNEEVTALNLMIGNRALCTVGGKREKQTFGSEWFLAEKPIPMIRQYGLPNRVAVVGLGCGITLSSVLDGLPQNGTVDVIEINPAMPEMTRKFNDWNGDVLSDPRVNLNIEDGFTFFMGRESKPDYGLVLIDLAWMQNHNSSHLFSQEFYQSVKKSMAPNGVVAVWTEEYTPTQTLAVMYKTLKSVFRDVVVNGDRGYFILFATDHPTMLYDHKFPGQKNETYWAQLASESVEINRLDNLVLNRTKFTLFGTRDVSEVNGPSVYQRVIPAQNP